MIIKIDPNLLDAQIRECDIKANNASSEEERDAFDGIANLLSHILFAVTQGDEIIFSTEV
jgi:hypothetical protein